MKILPHTTNWFPQCTSPVEIPENRSFANPFLQCFTGRSPSAVFVLRPGGQQRLLRAASFVSRRAILIPWPNEQAPAA